MAITYAIRKSKRNGRYIVFRIDTQIRGFGRWRIVRNYPTQQAAESYIRGQEKLG